MEEKIYTVYCHENKLNGKKYFGITKQNPERRWRNGNGYIDNKYFSYAIKKYGWDRFEHIIILDGLLKDVAFEIEIYLIKKYNTTNENNGYNLSEGGEYNKLTEKSRLKLSKSLKGHVPHNKGVPNSEEVRRKISESLQKMNRKITREQILKTSRNVVQISKDGKFIKRWEIMTEASKELNINLSSIWHCCNHKFKTSGGFIFIYEEEYNLMNKTKIDKLVELANEDIVSRKVVQLSKDGKFVNIFNSVTEASIKTCSNLSHISKCCKKKAYYTNNFMWMYLEEYEKMTEEDIFNYINIMQNKMEENRKTRISNTIESRKGKLDKKIVQLDCDNNFIKIWESIKSASEFLNVQSGHISSCCTEHRNKTGGFKWMYYDKYIEKYGNI